MPSLSSSTQILTKLISSDTLPLVVLAHHWHRANQVSHSRGIHAILSTNLGMYGALCCPLPSTLRETILRAGVDWTEAKLRVHSLHPSDVLVDPLDRSTDSWTDDDWCFYRSLAERIDDDNNRLNLDDAEALLHAIQDGWW